MYQATNWRQGSHISVQKQSKAVMLVYQTNPMEVELVCYVNILFVPINLYGSWPREWKHSGHAGLHCDVNTKILNWTELLKKFSGTKLSWTLTCNLKMWDFFSIWEIICILIFHSSWSGRFDFFECREILTKWSTTTWRLQTQRKLWSISITIDPVNLASEAEVKGNSRYEFCMYLLLHFHAVCTMHNTSFRVLLRG